MNTWLWVGVWILVALLFILIIVSAASSARGPPDIDEDCSCSRAFRSARETSETDWREKLTDEARLQYYVGDTTPDPLRPVGCEYPERMTMQSDDVVPIHSIHYRDVKDMYEWKKQVHYVHEFCDDVLGAWERLPPEYKTDDNRLDWMFFDNWITFYRGMVVKSFAPEYTSTRPTVCLMQRERHFTSVMPNVTENDRHWLQKSNKCVWRGMPSGSWHGMRQNLVEQWFEKHNVGWRGLLTEFEPDNPYTRDEIGILDILKHKYLISIDGHDVASDLKWKMLSNSVVLKMPSASVSWFMEDLLEPWVHYVPLNRDASDLEEKLEWCRSHQKECQEIAANATEWAQSFMDEDRETRLNQQVLMRYFDARRGLTPGGRLMR